MTNQPINVTCVDDNVDIARLMRVRINMEPDLRCDQCFTAVEPMLAYLASVEPHAAPDVILLDWTMPDRNASSSIGRIAHYAPGARVIVFSGHDESTVGQEALAAGAHRYVSKHDDLDHLLKVIREVAPAR